MDRERLVYPGDRRMENCDLEDAQLALLYLKEGKSMREVVRMFIASGLSHFKACDVYHGAKYLQQLEANK